MTASILVVDDSTADRLAVIAALEKRGLAVRGADGVEAAEDALREFVPHVVVIDWSMYRAGPLERATVGGGGAQLLRRIRARAELHGVAVVVYSSGRREEIWPVARKLGANVFVEKPTFSTMDKLIDEIDALLASRSR